jgi:Holliday junction resolvase RusA-like endonuclease
MIRAKKPKARQIRVPCEAEITLPEDWRGDTDNIKCVLDGLQAFGVILNDRLVRKLTIIRAPIKGSRVAVRPLEMSDEASPFGKQTADGFEAATDGKGPSPAARTPGDF